MPFRNRSASPGVRLTSLVLPIAAMMRCAAGRSPGTLTSPSTPAGGSRACPRRLAHRDVPPGDRPVLRNSSPLLVESVPALVLVAAVTLGRACGVRSQDHGQRELPYPAPAGGVVVHPTRRHATGGPCSVLVLRTCPSGFHCVGRIRVAYHPCGLTCGEHRSVVFPLDRPSLNPVASRSTDAAPTEPPGRSTGWASAVGAISPEIHVSSAKAKPKISSAVTRRLVFRCCHRLANPAAEAQRPHSRGHRLLAEALAARAARMFCASTSCRWP